MTALEFTNDHLTKISLKEEQLLELTNSLDYETIEAWGTETDTVFATFSVVARRKGQDYVVVLTYHDLDHVILTEGLMNYVALIAWDGWDLADVARDLLDGWQTVRVKAQEQWQDRMVDSSNVVYQSNGTDWVVISE